MAAARKLFDTGVCQLADIDLHSFVHSKPGLFLTVDGVFALLARLARVDPQLLRPIRRRSEQAQADLMRIRIGATLVEARIQSGQCGAVAGVRYPLDGGEQDGSAAAQDEGRTATDALS